MILKRVFAEILFLFHVGFVLFILFGWIVPSFWYFYILALVVTATADVIFGYCILSK